MWHSLGPIRTAVLTLVLVAGVAPPISAHTASAVGTSPGGSGVVAGTVDLGPVSPDTSLSVLLTLKDPNAGKLAADVSAMYTPGSKTYGHYLTAKDLATHYGPSPASIAHVRAALRSINLFSADWHQGSDWMLASGQARFVEADFGVQVHWFRASAGQRFYAGLSDSTLPNGLRTYVTAAGRINSDWSVSPDAVPSGGLAPGDLMAAYDVTPLRQAGMTGKGQTVVFFESDGFTQSELDTFDSHYGLPSVQPTIKGAPESSMKPDGETTMDLEVVHELAPDANLVVYNFDSSNLQTNDQVNKAMLDLQTQMVNDNPKAIISQSWSWPDQDFGQAYAAASKNIYDQADALGESVFASTGDDGAYECLKAEDHGTPPSPAALCTGLPAASPGVTAVGGTRLSVAADPTSSKVLGWYDETVWEDPALTNGTGGGVSAFYPRPSWQQGPGVDDSTLNPKNMRSIPDVSADADDTSGAAIYESQGGSAASWTTGSGTSQATPIWAGITALIDQFLQQQGQPIAGFLNPALYHVAANPSPFTAFHDVTIGTNLYYPATPGYDMATGLGTPDAWNLARDLVVYEQGGGQ